MSFIEEYTKLIKSRKPQKDIQKFLLKNINITKNAKIRKAKGKDEYILTLPTGTKLIAEFDGIDTFYFDGMDVLGERNVIIPEFLYIYKEKGGRVFKKIEIEKIFKDAFRVYKLLNQ
jgi:hypothetical protein